jgi:hypothetical protein
MQRALCRTVLLVAAVGTLIFTPAVAMAAGGNHGGSSPVVASARNLHVLRVTSAVLGRTSNRVVAPDAACPITRGAQSGAGICGTTVLDIQWSDGRFETFVVGLDHATWHVFQRYAGDPTWAGWYSLGGYAIDGVWLWSSSPVTFYVVGSDNNLWCQRSTPGQTPSGWSGFYRC